MTTQPLKVGITGGIGSGKSTVCKIFEILKIPIYYADDRAKALMVTNPTLIAGIKKIFGVEAYLPNGSLNRQHIAQIAFSDKGKLAQLNGLVHPAVHADGSAWTKAQIGVPYTLKEAALHFESGGYKLFDKTITVFAPKAIRLQRVLQRDKTTTAAIEARMNKQMPEEEKIKLADFVIYNDGSQSLIRQVLAIHKRLIE